MALDPMSFVARRALEIDASGIRKVFDLAAKLKDPINLSIGQPDFDVPEELKEKAIAAIREGKNRYTPTQGIAELIAPLKAEVMRSTGWIDPGMLILSGTSAGLMLAMFASLNPGDEVLFLDPYFVMYKHLPRLCGAVPVAVDSYPDFRLHAERLEAAITPRSKMLVLCSPNNPTGITLTKEELAAAAAIAKKHNLLVIADEIYETFTYGVPGTGEAGKRPALQGHAGKRPALQTGGRAPAHESIAALLPEQCILLKGYSKTYGMTGWRLGYAAGAGAAKGVIEQMTKLQQYTFVCAPSMVQYAALASVGDQHIDMSEYVAAYKRKRDMVVEMLGNGGGDFELNAPGGAFYAFPKVPAKFGSATEFVAKAIERNVLIIPGNVFSARDTHFRLSYATTDAKLEQGLEILRDLARG